MHKWIVIEFSKEKHINEIPISTLNLSSLTNIENPNMLKEMFNDQIIVSSPPFPPKKNRDVLKVIKDHHITNSCLQNSSRLRFQGWEIFSFTHEHKNKVKKLAKILTKSGLSAMQKSNFYFNKDTFTISTSPLFWKYITKFCEATKTSQIATLNGFNGDLFHLYLLQKSIQSSR